MSFGLRLGEHPQVFISTTPKPIPLLKRLIKDETCALTKGTTYDNRANLAKSFFEKTVTRYENTRLGRQELLAEILGDNPDVELRSVGQAAGQARGPLPSHRRTPRRATWSWEDKESE